NLSDARSSPYGIYMPAFPPNRRNPAVRNDREGRENDGIIRSPCSRLDSTRLRGGRSVMSVPSAISEISSQIIPLKGRTNFQESLRIPTSETIRVCAAAYSQKRNSRMGIGSIAKTKRGTAVVLAWTIRGGHIIASPESGSVAHVKENAVPLTLTPQELQTLDAAHPPPSR